MVDITIPIAEVDPSSYCQQHVDIRLEPSQARLLRSVCIGLDLIGERLANGRRVVNAPDSIRWLLEQIPAPDKSKAE